MNTNKFVLGPIQLDWLKELEEHPERQMTGSLGQKDGTDMRLCCLGQYQLCHLKAHNIESTWVDGRLYSGVQSAILGRIDHCFNDGSGRFAKPVVLKDKTFRNLAGMNDKGMTWPEIVAYVRTNPENVFTKSL